VPEPSSSLFGAYFRYTGEDRLTEVLATVLERSPALVASIAGRSGLSAPHRYEVRTQVRPPSGVRVDLEIRGFSEDHSPAWLLWSEHKTHTSFHGDQLQRYRKSLAADPFADTKRLVAILLGPPTPSEREQAQRAEATLMSWGDIALACRRLRTQGDDAVAEWIDFFTNEMGEQVAEPLTAGGVDIAVQADALYVTLEDLTEQPMRAACDELGLPAPKAVGDYWASTPTAGWAAEHGVKLYMQYDVHGEVGGEPAFKIGFYTVGEDAANLAEDADLADKLREAGLGVYADGARHAAEFDIWCEVAMSEVTTEPSLEAQRARLGGACTAFFNAVLTGDLAALAES
jgi:hypothetical protein